MFMTSSSAWTRLACLALLAVPLGACSTVDRVSTASVVPHDYRARHPLVIANAPVTPRWRDDSFFNRFAR